MAIVILVFLFNDSQTIKKNTKTVERQYGLTLNHIKHKLVGQKLDGFSTLFDYKLPEKAKLSMIIYLPEKICYSCIEELLKLIAGKDKSKYILIIHKTPNPSVIGLLKYNKLLDISLFDNKEIFSKIIMNNELFYNPISLKINNDRIEEIIAITTENIQQSIADK